MIYLLYLVVAALVTFMSIKASEYVDMLDKTTSLSGAFLGGILLSAVTSLPELFTSISSTLMLDQPGLCIGNILGSNLFNYAMLSFFILTAVAKFAKCDLSKIHFIVAVSVIAMGGLILCNKEAADKFNFNKAIFPGIQGGPLMHVIAAKAVCFKEALSDEFKAYQKAIVDNAQALSNGLKSRGIKIVSGGTDNHLMLVDLTPFGLTGKAVEKLLDAAHITANKNTIPNDPQSPFVTSGIRLGTPAATSRGLNTEDMDQVAEAIALVIKGGEDKVPEARAIIQKLTDKYPLD